MSIYLPDHLPEAAKTTIKDTTSYVETKLDAGRTDRSNMAEAIVMDQILKPLSDVVDQWDTLSEKQRDGLLAERSAVIKASVDSLTPSDMRMTLENLAKMKKYGEKFAEALMADPEKYAWVTNSLKFVLGMQADSGSSVDAGEQQTIKDISEKGLAKAPKDPAVSAEPLDPEFSFACTILAFASPATRMKIVKGYLDGQKAKMSVAEKQNFLKVLCDYAGVSPLEIDELLASPDEKLSDVEMTKLGKNWEEKNNFMAEARRLSVDSYGAKNKANEMFTVSNILRTFGYVAGTATVLLNWVVNYKDIKEDPTYAFRIPQVLFGGAEVAVAAYSDSDKTPGEMIASKDTLKGWNDKKAQDNLLSVVGASPRGWKALLEDNNSLGIRTLAVFVNEKCKNGDDLKESETTVAKFEAYVKELQAKNTGKPYDQLLAQVSKIVGSEDNSDLTGSRFKKLANSFLKLDMLGDDMEVVNTYNNALTGALGTKAKPQASDDKPTTA